MVEQISDTIADKSSIESTRSTSMNQFDLLAIVGHNFENIDKDKSKTISVDELREFRDATENKGVKAAAGFVLDNFSAVTNLADNQPEINMSKMRAPLARIVGPKQFSGFNEKYAFSLGDDVSLQNRFNGITKKDLSIGDMLRSNEEIKSIVADVRQRETREGIFLSSAALLFALPGVEAIVPPLSWATAPLGAVAVGVATYAVSEMVNDFRHSGSNILNDAFQQRRKMILDMKLDRLAP